MRRQRPNGHGGPELPHTRIKERPHTDDDIDTEIRRLRRENPSRSLEWISRQTGQPLSHVRAVIGNGSAE
jgi:hypothetical protein